MSRINNSYYGMTRTCFGATTVRASAATGGGATGILQTNIPAGIAEPPGLIPPNGSGPWRKAFNFLYFPWAMCTIQNVQVASNAGATTGWQWATSDAGPWNFLGDGVRDVLPLSPTTTGFRSVGFFISDAVRYAGNVVLRIVTQGGDGVADPRWINMGLWVSQDLASGFIPLTAGIETPVVPVAPSCTTSRRNQASFSNWASSNCQWVNQPAALTEYNGSTASRLTQTFAAASWKFNWVDWNLRINIPGASGTTRYSVQASTDGGTTWQYMDGVDSPFRLIGTQATGMGTPVVILDAIRTAGIAGNIIIRIVGINGNGVADPAMDTLAFTLNYYHINPTGAN